MVFNYNKLVGLMREKQVTQEMLAMKIGNTPTTLSLKLNNKANFKQSEIIKICDYLGIQCENIGTYFFTT